MASHYSPRIGWCFLAATLLFTACDKVNPEVKSDPVAEVADEALSEQDLALLDALPVDTKITLEDIFLDDGSNAKQFLEKYNPAALKQKLRLATTQLPLSNSDLQKRYFISSMTNAGLMIADSTNHDYPDEGTNKPAQKRIWYMAGGKQYRNRQNPTAGTCNLNLLYHGLDCSGFIYQMTQALGVSVAIPLSSATTTALNKEEIWNKAFQASSDFNLVKMEKRDKVPLTGLEAGDIICWSGHIGMIITKGSSLELLASNGSFNDGDKQGCSRNLKKGRGPVSKPISASFLQEFGKTYHILRVVPNCKEGTRLTMHAKHFLRKDIFPNFYGLHFNVTGGYPPYNVTVKDARGKLLEAGTTTSASCGETINNLVTVSNKPLISNNNYLSPLQAHIVDSKGIVQDTTMADIPLVTILK